MGQHWPITPVQPVGDLRAAVLAASSAAEPRGGTRRTAHSPRCPLKSFPSPVCGGRKGGRGHTPHPGFLEHHGRQHGVTGKQTALPCSKGADPPCAASTKRGQGKLGTAQERKSLEVAPSGADPPLPGRHVLHSFASRVPAVGPGSPGASGHVVNESRGALVALCCKLWSAIRVGLRRTASLAAWPRAALRLRLTAKVVQESDAGRLAGSGKLRAGGGREEVDSVCPSEALVPAHGSLQPVSWEGVKGPSAPFPAQRGAELPWMGSDRLLALLTQPCCHGAGATTPACPAARAHDSATLPLCPRCSPRHLYKAQLSPASLPRTSPPPTARANEPRRRSHAAGLRESSPGLAASLPCRLPPAPACGIFIVRSLLNHC